MRKYIIHLTYDIYPISDANNEMDIFFIFHLEKKEASKYRQCQPARTSYDTLSDQYCYNNIYKKRINRVS